MKSKILIAIIASVALQSCSTVSSAITGLPIPSTAVTRAGHDGENIVLISSADYALAEQAPIGTVHGLYNAGYIVENVRAIVIESTK